ncbi:MAG: Holliday junction branch migration protein RuvA [Deltaproteobacteria bacterium]|nr:MAG: Holliday junction branch migration protein RuvA [Deltaproteobacteria bacterium]
MIAWLKGDLRMRDDEGRIILDVGGVGYALTVPIGVAGQAELGDTVELFVHTHVREDQIALFGFEDEAQLQAFNALLGVSKVGPKLAVNVLSGIDPAGLADAIDRGDLARLATISGVGKRLAERLSVELRGKLAVAPQATTARIAPRGAEPQTFRDLRSALANLQYRPKEVDAALAQLREEAPDAEFDVLLRRALALLRK